MPQLINTLPLTPLLYVTGALLSAIIAGSAFASYHRSRNKTVLYLSLSFLFLSLHSFALSVPALFDASDLVAIGRGYVVGMVFLYLLLLTALRVQTSLRKGFFEKHSFVITAILLGAGAAVVGIGISDFRLPIVTSRGLIFWNQAPLAAWLAGGTSLVYGLVWADFFQQTGRLVRGLRAKIKMLILSLDGVMMGLAGLLVFTSQNTLETLIGHGLFVAACALSVFIFFLGEN